MTYIRTYLVSLYLTNGPARFRLHEEDFATTRAAKKRGLRCVTHRNEVGLREYYMYCTDVSDLHKFLAGAAFRVHCFPKVKLMPNSLVLRLSIDVSRFRVAAV